jgi:hypothetical protein
MWKGKDLTMTCQLMINTPPQYVEERPLEINVYYRYQTQKTTPIKVFGKQTGFDTGYGGYGYSGWAGL